MRDISRRNFLFLTGGSGAAMTLEPGRQLVNKLIPWVIPPENIKPGKWTFFATTCRECPAGCGMVLRHRDGRVTKAEGNPLHPVNVGGLCPRGQSSLQGLYDPDRVKQVLHRYPGEDLMPSSWENALEALSARLRGGKGRVALITQLETGALAEVMESFVRTFDSQRLLYFEAFNYEPLRTAHETFFGRFEIPLYQLDQCELILSFGADFLETWVSPVGFASQFASMHSYQGGKLGEMAYVGPRLSMTAGNADEFIQVHPGRERWVALAMVQEILDRDWARGSVSQIRNLAESLNAKEALSLSGVEPEKIRRLAEKFVRARSSAALGGPTAARGPAARDLTAAVTLLNLAAGRIGQTVTFRRSHALSRTATDEEMTKLIASLSDEDILIIHHSNLAFTRPYLTEGLKKAGTIVYLTTLPDETALIADWVLPVDTSLESWGDYEPYSGIHSLIQPTMARLYESRPAGDFLIALADAAGRPLSRPAGKDEPSDFREWLLLRWRERYREFRVKGNFESFWRKALQQGGVWVPPPEKEAEVRSGVDVKFTPQNDPPDSPERVDLWLWPSIYFFDGRLANRGWLQEMPHPVSTIAWGSWMDIHPRTAMKLNLKEGDLVDVTTPAGTVRVSSRITEEVAERTAAIVIGQGHVSPFLSVAKGWGVNPFTLLAVEKPEGMFPRVTLERTGLRDYPVYVSSTREQHDREILQTVRLSALRQGHPGLEGHIIYPTPEGYNPARDIYAPHNHVDHRWAMAIDLQKCIGCHACSVACYAENNIPVMGRTYVERGREMAWLRVPPYRLSDHPEKIAWLPLPCQHCDAAPCEPVCPVFAAVHTEEGLNAQIYNRCVGTRYCSNNCPYKVRRFNWFNTKWVPPLELQLNPEVTVRSRGVMEKCTFCVQRIRLAEYEARREDRKIRDGEVQPACVQSCPARVFVFGDLHDRDSEIYRIFTEHPRRYQVLRELNTKPAVVYLKKIVIDE